MFLKHTKDAISKHTNFKQNSQSLMFNIVAKKKKQNKKDWLNEKRNGYKNARKSKICQWFAKCFFSLWYEKKDTFNYLKEAT